MAQQRPKTKELKQIYMQLLSASISTRINALSLALQWWDVTIYWMENQPHPVWDLRQKKLLVLCNELRQCCIAADQLPDKEELLKRTIETYERVRPRFRVPKVAEFYALLKKRRPRLEKRQERQTERFHTMLNLLAGLSPRSFSGMPVKITVGSIETLDPLLWTRSYTKHRLQELQKLSRAEGPLAVLLVELPKLSRAGALISDGNGGFAYDPEKHVAAMTAMLYNTITFLRTPEAPKRLVKSFKEEVNG